MQSIRINNNAGVCHIDIEGTIGVPEEWQFDQPEQRIATYEKFRDAVRRIGEIDAPEVVVNIRSTGGDVNDALLIHDALRQLSGRITTRCYGYTASAATIIAQAASDGCREISANALYLIHTSICATEGNAAELSGKIDLLRHTDRRLAEIYAARSGRTAEEFETLMAENNGNGRWLSPEETLAAGLADTIIDAGGTTTETSSAHPRNDARGWARLLAALGLHRGKGPSDELLDDRNVLHFDDEPESRQTSSIASDEAFRHAAPTTTRPCED
ncbi:MAG: Clp protease ClpP, partial [Alistipes sp.]|nr:Clp protease ClpP [Alistipes sp.]